MSLPSIPATRMPRRLAVALACFGMVAAACGGGSAETAIGSGGDAGAKGERAAQVVGGLEPDNSQLEDAGTRDEGENPDGGAADGSDTDRGASTSTTEPDGASFPPQPSATVATTTSLPAPATSSVPPPPTTGPSVPPTSQPVPSTTEPPVPDPREPVELTPLADCVELDQLLSERVRPHVDWPVPVPLAAPALEASGAAADAAPMRNTVEDGVAESDRMVTDGRYLASISATGRLSVLDVSGTTPRLIHEQGLDSWRSELVLHDRNLWLVEGTGPTTELTHLRLSGDAVSVSAHHTISGHYGAIRVVGGRAHLSTSRQLFDNAEGWRTTVDGAPVPCNQTVVLDGEVSAASDVTSFSLAGGRLSTATVFGGDQLSNTYGSLGSIVLHSPDGWGRGGNQRTELVRFSVGAGAPEAVAHGSVDGRIPGPFAISDRGGVLRLVLSDLDGANAVVTLRANDLEPIGNLQRIAPGESVFGVRFLDSVVHMITFERIDPLHVIDLSDPAAPRQLGELEVPGFSRYLHPVGPGQLLGVGDLSGEASSVLFDVSDPTRPREAARVTEGPAPWSLDHRSVLWSADHGLFAFQDGNQDLRLVTLRNGKLASAGVVETPGWNDEVRPVIIGDELLVVGSQWLVPVDLDGLVAGDAVALVADPVDEPPIVICGLGEPIL